MTPTFGGVAFGLLFLVIELALWYPGVKALMGGKRLSLIGRLLPFVLSWCVGCLTVMVGSGLIGAGGDVVLWGMNVAGDGALIIGVGATPGSAPGTSGQPLTQGGLIMAFFLVVAFLIRMRTGYARSKALGLLSGVGMGLSAGVARYAAVPIASAANISGVWLTGMVTG